MISVAKLRRKPHQFRSLMGLTVLEFDELLAEFTPAYETARLSRRCHAGRKREAGAGHPFALPVAERLLMALVYFRLYVSQSLLSLLFDVDQSTVSREVFLRVLPVLEGILPVPLRDTPLGQWAKDADRNERAFPVPVGKGKRITTLKALLETYPEMEELLLDATEQPVPQPKNKRQRKLAFSGKQHDHTIKTQIVATTTQILHVCGGLPGSVHDVTVLGGSGVLLSVPAAVKVRLDRGYQGCDKGRGKPDVQSPVRKVRGHTVTAFGKAYNHLLSVLRIPVEHHFARLKQFRILSTIYRSDTKGHESVFCVIAGLLNFRAAGAFTLREKADIKTALCLLHHWNANYCAYAL